MITLEPLELKITEILRPLKWRILDQAQKSIYKELEIPNNVRKIIIYG